MVKCTKCGAEHQGEGVYCSNCAVPVHREQAESLRAPYKSRVNLIVGVIVGLVIIGLGAVLGLFSDDMGMAGAAGLGYVILVAGFIVILVSVVMFGWLRR